MPLQPSRILELLNARREEFSHFNQMAVEQADQYLQALKQFMAATDRERATLFNRLGGKVGAFPLEPLQGTPQGIVAAGLHWQNREESLRWVRDRLSGVTTFAVDGSQIYPGKDLSIPIALVQIGWFENHHRADGDYTKDVRVDVLTPQDLRTEAGDLADRMVNMRRYQLELERLVEYIEAHPQAENCLVFLDGSLVATFALRFDEEAKRVYIQSLLRLLRASEQHRVPLVAYIDTSYADDLTLMLRQLYRLPESAVVHDAQLVNRLSIPWGDRTPLFRCDRTEILNDYGEQAERIGFLYLKTTRENYPVRLEIPLWIYEDERLEQVLDWVRAEVIVGGGYPYAIETADQTAVLQAGDRQLFYRLLQEWADREKLKLKLSRKMVSKMRRR